MSRNPGKPKKAGPRARTNTSRPPTKPEFAPPPPASPEQARARVALLRTSAFGPSASPTLFPSDHVKMLLELLRPCGIELARRWVAALMLVPTDEREAVVGAIEASLAREYAGAGFVGEGRLTSVVHPPVQHDGYAEQVFTTYEVIEPTPDLPAAELEERPERRAG